MLPICRPTSPGHEAQRGQATCRIRQPVSGGCRRSWERSTPPTPPAPRGRSPADGVQQAQRRVCGTHVDVVLQDELVDPLDPLLATPGHEGGDPQDAAVEAVQPLQQLLPPRGVDQVLEGPLDDGGVHGHQVSLEPHIPGILLHGSQVAPAGEKGGNV